MVVNNNKEENIMDIERKEKLEEIITRLDSISEILYGLQLLDLNCNEFSALNVADFLELPIEELANIRFQLNNF